MADAIASTGRVITMLAAMICVLGFLVIGDPVRILNGPGRGE